MDAAVSRGLIRAGCNFPIEHKRHPGLLSGKIRFLLLFFLADFDKTFFVFSYKTMTFIGISSCGDSHLISPYTRERKTLCCLSAGSAGIPKM